ncbi:NAD(+) diphosphatase [Polycladidibacter hongkongensis]|uniref:NAD(+) diphosphatase n=1 Tax=Polycladidibacter hongkongensis TaxID=1647556 RepID=UPI0008359919|nr:NAD(+) diphosphatase [Pseudovibrio hongkongensis]
MYSTPFTPAEASNFLAYSDNRLDRLGSQRKKPEIIERLFGAKDTRFTLRIHGKFLCKQEGALATSLFTRDELEAYPVDWQQVILLGVDKRQGDAPIFSVSAAFFGDDDEFESYMQGKALTQQGGLSAQGLRTLALSRQHTPDQLGFLAQAQALLNWHETHPCCSKCGKKTVMAEAGYRRDCPACGAQHFPRTDPAVIMLVKDGNNCLLGRPYHLPENMYTTLAGFVEPGETFEQAVRRETFEEAGVEVEDVDYKASQPWPFPSCAMVGFHATARSTKLSIDYEEMEDCAWFSKQELARMLAGTATSGLFCPPDISIAYYLLKLFVEEG